MVSIFIEYIYWHFTVAPSGIVKIAGDYMKAGWARFLIARHFETLIDPWHRRQPSDLAVKKPIDITGKVVNAIIDFYIRLLAAIVRLTIIMTGLLYEAILAILFVVVIIGWFLWPFISILLVIQGLRIIFL